MSDPDDLTLALREGFGIEDAEFVALRRDLHRHPELSFEERRTAVLVAERLTAFGYEVERDIGGTGVVGQLRRGDAGRHVGLRADMDALPVTERGTAPWRSGRIGVMHACGHDGHTAMLLAAARRLAADGTWRGTLTLIFQPAEEDGGPRSGAARMIEDGLFERYPVDAIFAAHNAPTIPQGMLLFREGPMMASTDRATVRIEGRGGHGGMPQVAVDPVVAAAAIVMALQSVVARNVDPLEAGVITVGALHAGEAANVVPDTARLEISIRALQPHVRDLLERRIREVVEGQAAAYGVHASIEYRRGAPPVVNDPASTRFARDVAESLFGPQSVIAPCPAATASEDFAFMLERRPGCYLLIGNGTGTGPHGCMVHNPGYDFNDANIPVGARFWAELARRFLADGSGASR